MTSIVYRPPVYYAFYDGRPNVAASYEDKPGLAISHDLRRFTKLSTSGPILRSPYGTGCLRYLDAVAFRNRIYFFYELARQDGPHELRLSVAEL